MDTRRRDASIESSLERLKNLLSGVPKERKKHLHELLNKPHLNVFEAAELLSVHPETVRRAIREGRIAAFRVRAGTRRSPYKIPTSELEKLFETPT